MDFRHFLSALFCPDSVAVIGASSRVGSVGQLLWSHVVDGSPKPEVFPVNPKYKTIGEAKCFSNLKDLPAPVDLAILVSPPASYVKIMESCLNRKVKALLLCGGYPRASLNPEIFQKIQEASAKGLLILGPQSLGFVRPSLGLNASFMAKLPNKGNIGLISQSPGLSNAIAEYVMAANGGFSCIIDPGLEESLSVADFLNFLSADNETDCIALYLETFKEPRKLLTAISCAVKTKPVLILKGGASVSSADIVLKNSGLRQDEFGTMEEALIKAGAILVKSLSQLTEAIQAFMYRRTLMNGDLYAIGNSKGVDTLLADYTARAGLILARPSPEFARSITDAYQLPYPFFNPLNVGLSMPPDKLAELVSKVMEANDCAAVLLALVTNDMQKPEDVAKALVPIAKKSPKMLITVWLGGEDCRNAIRILNKNGMPAFDNIRAGTDALFFMKHFSYYEKKRNALFKDPPAVLESFFKPAKKIVSKAQAEGRNILYEEECKRLLASIGFNTAACMNAGSVGEAEQAAETLGYPVAMKIRVDGVLSKSDLGCVIVGIQDKRALVSAWNAMLNRAATNLISEDDFSVVIEKALLTYDTRELRMGIRTSGKYGPVVYLGIGGLYGEVACEEAKAFVPLSYSDAEQMVLNSSFSPLFGKYKGLQKIDTEYLILLLLRLSHLAQAVPALKNLEIDPLLCGVRDSTVLDSYASIGQLETDRESEEPHLLFPGNLAGEPELIEGRFGALFMRAAQHADSAAYRHYLETLSDQTKRLRFHGSTAVSENMVASGITFHRDVTYTIFAMDKKTVPPSIRGEATFSLLPNGLDAEFGVSVADGWQGKGLSGFLMGAIEKEAKRRGIRYLIGYVLKDNIGMDKMMTKRGYVPEPDEDDPHVNLYKLDLRK